MHFQYANTTLKHELPRYIMKVMVVGDVGVIQSCCQLVTNSIILKAGKTSIARRYCLNVFRSQYRATVGVDFASRKIKVDGTCVQIQLWDLAGQERFGTMTHVYYKASKAALIVFDLTASPPSFEAVLKWKNDIDSKVLFIWCCFGLIRDNFTKEYYMVIHVFQGSPA